MFIAFHIGFTGLLGLLYKLLKVFTSLAGFTSLLGLLYELKIFLSSFGFTGLLGLLGLLHVPKIYDIFILVFKFTRFTICKCKSNLFIFHIIPRFTNWVHRFTRFTTYT